MLTQNNTSPPPRSRSRRRSHSRSRRSSHSRSNTRSRSRYREIIMIDLNVNTAVCTFYFSFQLSFVGLALADAAPVPGQAAGLVPSQDTSLAPNLHRASLAHATVNLILGPVHTNLAVDQLVANLAPAQTSASPGLRALLKLSQIVGDPRRSRSARNPEADLLRLWRMAMGGVPSLLLALHHLRLKSPQTGIHVLAQSLARAQNPAPVPDQSPKTSIKCNLLFFSFFPTPPPTSLGVQLSRPG